MKKTQLLVGLLLMASITFAHTVKPQCWNKGRFSFLVADVPKNLTVKISFNGWDTTFKCPSSSFSVSIPQAGQFAVRTVKFQFSDGYAISTSTTSSACSVLPLEYKLFQVKSLGNRTLEVKFTIYDVVNVKQINILYSEDQIHWKPIGLVLSDNIKEDVPYTLTLKY